MMRNIVVSIIFILSGLLAAPTYAKNLILKFEGVPMTMAPLIKKKLPFVFEREVNLAEVDQVVKLLMATQSFSNIEVFKRTDGEREAYLLSASVLKKIKNITVDGNTAFPRSHILEVLKIAVRQDFKRKELLAHVEEMQKDYVDAGYLNTQIDIEFESPGEGEVNIHVKVKEGEPCLITEVVIETNNNILSAKAKRLSRQLIRARNSAVNVRAFEASIKDYFSTNRFLAAKLSPPTISLNADRTGAKLNYLVENPVRFEFFFYGNTYFSDGQLIEKMELDKVVGITTSPAQDLVDRIRKAYQNAGFSNVNVEYRERASEALHKNQIRFTIVEGPRVRIDKIDVTGNLSQPADYYIDYLKKNSGELIASGYFNRKDLENGYKSLTQDLQNLGYLKAKLQSARVEYSKNKSLVSVYLVFDEGPLTQIQEIQFEGVESFKTEDLLTAINLKSGAPLHLKDLESALGKLKDYYRSRGFLEMRITNEDDSGHLVTYNESSTQATIHLQIQEGPKVKVAEIELQGNTFTQDYVIMRELAFKPGDTLTPSAIEESTYRLQKLQIFGQVQIKTLEAGTNIAERTVLVEVAERDPGIVTSGLGLQKEQSLVYKTYLGVAYKNLSGTGRGVSGRADLFYSQDPKIQYPENILTFGYLEPYLFRSPANGRVNLRRYQRFFQFDGPATKGSAIIWEQNSAELIYERELSRHLRLSYYAINFSKQKYFYAQPGADTNGVNAISVVDVSKTGPVIELDLRDDPVNPTRGSYHKLSFSYSDPAIGSSNDSANLVQFFKTEVASVHYKPLVSSKRVLWSNQARGGFVANTSSSPVSGVPYSETFSLGGITTIRGYDPSERFPTAAELNQPTYNSTSFKMTSENTYFLVKSELRFPIMSANNSLYGAIFYDGGAVYMTQPDVIIDPNFRDSIGLGFRIVTPVGPVNGDLAFKLKRRTGRDRFKNPIDETPVTATLTIGNF